MTTRPSAAELYSLILAGDRRALSRAATLVENQHPTARDLVAKLFPHTGRAMIVGVTGPPGAGKSTLVSALTANLRSAGETVGIIAVDPSSPYSHGALLGDRIRMDAHHSDSGVFIRSVATRGALGGLARSTLELALLFDAAGLGTVLIETVGAGQDEIDIARLADVTVVVLVPGFGDDVQAIKAGFMEIANVFAINKADLPGAERLEQDIWAMQSLAEASERQSTAPVRRIVATREEGVDELLSAIRSAFAVRGKADSRRQIWALRLKDMLRDALLAAIPLKEIERHAALVASKLEDPYAALSALMTVLQNKA